MKRFLVIVALAAAFFAVSPAPAQAAVPAPLYQVAACQGGLESFLWFKTWDSCLDHDGQGAPLLKSLNGIWLILLVLIEDGIKAAGYAAAGFVTWGGIKYLKSQGDPGQLNEARQVIYNALFGLVLALLSVAIVNFVAGAIK